MAAGVFDIALGAYIEKVRDGAANVGLLLLKTVEGTGTLRTRATVAAILAAANTEATATNYARKTGLTGTINVDTAGHVATLDVPDQAFTSLGGAVNNSLVMAVFFYNEGGTDATRIPLTWHTLSVTTDGTTLTVIIDASGIAKDSGI